MNANKYRKCDHAILIKNPIITTYHDLLNDRIKVMSRGTWQNDEQVIVLIRYVLEVKLGLSKAEIPLINRTIIAENKLWGALNRFKSLHKLIHFVYPGVYHECDFQRVTPDYWSDVEKIKERFEWKLKEENLLVSDIPSFITCHTLLKWGFSNPLKRHGDSPFRLMNALYPNRFKETDFKKTPQRFRKDKTALRKQILEILQSEGIHFEDVPEKVNHELFRRHHLLGVLSSYSSSISKLFCSLFPENFTADDFTKPNGYWDNLDNTRIAIQQLFKRDNILEKDIPTYLTKIRLQEAKLGGLLYRFHGSPIEIVQILYPGRFSVLEFQRVPNKYWYNRDHRIQAMRDFCHKYKITRKGLPLLNRAYFRKHFPRFISIADRHYDSKFYQWIIESFPEYKFTPEEFELLVGKDGQICDSKEELILHNFFLQTLTDADIQREKVHFRNEQADETYIPDWIIEQNSSKYIVEYFGLYGSGLYPGYTEKAKRKIEFYSSIKDYQFMAIFPADFKEEGFDRLVKILKDAKVRVVY
ncbi:hypothetical protein [Bacillus benzoevorans]|uniref:DUF4046 domain-containing protein n=1 Tax=Bacillus benzoevorans TaxID=1456 RepID=A0A7X0HV11_9BACI|nr:hypothetical protein [Bacillus benzoevorans]MBB6447301.1 hypothetical protein [Bacillus benzoevorans]